MSVRVVRTRNGEDVICDLYEVTTKEEPDKAIAFQLTDPYSVWIDPSNSINVETDEEVKKATSPDIVFDPYIPLAKDKKVMLKLDEVVTVYETHEEVVSKYEQLVEASHGRKTDQTGSSEGQT